MRYMSVHVNNNIIVHLKPQVSTPFYVPPFQIPHARGSFLKMALPVAGNEVLVEHCTPPPIHPMHSTIDPHVNPRPPRLNVLRCLAERAHLA
jgi:hypothetical protein